MSIFHAETVVTEHISEADIRAYIYGLDFGVFRHEDLANVLMSALVDFAFGYHTGILDKYTDRELKEAAQSIYKIKSFSEAKCIYVDNDDSISAEDLKNQKKYLKRGEFGELILHVFLRDFMDTVPLLSKIYFKDSDGVTVHGFDSVHIGKAVDGEGDSIYFGESKLYARANDKAGEFGIKDLLGDIKGHFSRDFLKREFALIGKKKYSFKPLGEYEDMNTVKEYEDFLKTKKAWFYKLHSAEQGSISLESFLNSVTIPLLCTYESALLTNCSDITNPNFLKEYEKQIEDLKTIFKEELSSIEDELGEPVKTNLNIVLLLFPVPSKKALIKTLHEKLYSRANI